MCLCGNAERRTEETTEQVREGLLDATRVSLHTTPGLSPEGVLPRAGVTSQPTLGAEWM